MSALLLTALAALAATTTAHGTVSGIVADGTYFGGFKLDYYYMQQSGQTPPATVGWSAENLDNGYVGGDQSTYDSPDIICHKNAKNSATSATVKAGGKVAFQWTAWPESHVGPVITYAANCGGDCSTVKKEDLKFVKLDEAGFENGKWAAVAMIANNNTYEMTVPSTLAAGKYVFRHEIIALHSAGNVNGAQNYPQCLNIEVTGSGTENPEGTLGTKLYTNQDKGILFNVYTQNIDYPIPGPALFGSGSGSGSGSAPSASASAAPSATSSSAPKPTSAAPSTTQAPTKPTTTANAAVTSTTVQVTSTVNGSQPSATATSAPSTGNGDDNALPKTFTAETFIAWFEKQAGISSSKARRHAREFFGARLP